MRDARITHKETHLRAEYVPARCQRHCGQVRVDLRSVRRDVSRINGYTARNSRAHVLKGVYEVNLLHTHARETTRFGNRKRDGTNLDQACLGR